MVDVRRLPVGEDGKQVAVLLDELAREGARRMIAAALRAEADGTSRRSSRSSMSRASGWWCATAWRRSGV